MQTNDFPRNSLNIPTPIPRKNTVSILKSHKIVKSHILHKENNVCLQTIHNVPVFFLIQHMQKQPYKALICVRTLQPAKPPPCILAYLGWWDHIVKNIWFSSLLLVYHVNRYSAVGIVITVGVFVTIIAFMGWYGAKKESTCLLCTVSRHN